MVIRVAFVLLVVALSQVSTAEITGVPYFGQLTEFGCGDASMEMVMGYWGVQTSQLQLGNLMRTAYSTGTLSLDMHRAPRASFLSLPMASLYAPVVPSIRLGLMSGWSDGGSAQSPQPWLALLQQLVVTNSHLILKFF